jgi:hypothetical protein
MPPAAALRAGGSCQSARWQFPAAAFRPPGPRVRRLFDDASRHQRPAEADRDQPRILRGCRIPSRRPARAPGCAARRAPGHGRRNFTKEDQRLLQRVVAGGMDLHQFLDSSSLNSSSGGSPAGDKGAVELVLDHPVGEAGAGVGEYPNSMPGAARTAFRARGRCSAARSPWRRCAVRRWPRRPGAPPRRLPFQHQQAAAVVEQDATAAPVPARTPSGRRARHRVLIQPTDARGDVGLHGVQLARRARMPPSSPPPGKS